MRKSTQVAHTRKPATAIRNPQDADPEGIHLVRDPFGSAVAGLYESSNVMQFPDSVDEEPEPIPESRWPMFGDQALAAAQEEQRRIKEKIRPHVERYRKITGNKR